MTLLERIHANRCAVVGCERERAEGAAVCRDDLRELWGNRLTRRSDGTYTRNRVFPVRAEWPVAA